MDKGETINYKFNGINCKHYFNQWVKGGDLLYNAIDNKKNIIKDSIKIIQETNKSIKFECKIK